MLSLRLIEETTNAANINWLLWVTLGFFAVMVLVGWLVSRKEKPEESESQKHNEKEIH